MLVLEGILRVPLVQDSYTDVETETQRIVQKPKLACESASSLNSTYNALGATPSFLRTQSLCLHKLFSIIYGEGIDDSAKKNSNLNPTFKE